jgi:signal transduction histidine kinase/ligand-binding sensor domain-containing protein
MKRVFWLKRIGRGIAAVVVAILPTVWPSLALALNPSLDVSQHGHRAWRIRDGFGLGMITAIAQTTDGYMWLSTRDGLLRFDGIRTVLWRPPASDLFDRETTVRALLATQDGSLWIGTPFGLGRLRAGELFVLPSMRGKRVNALHEDADGTVWAGGLEGPVTQLGTVSPGKGMLCAIRQDEAVCQGHGQLGREVIAVQRDASNALWVAGFDRVWKWGTEPMVSFALPAHMSALRAMVARPEGGIVLGLDNQVVSVSDAGIETVQLPEWAQSLSFNRALRDRDGALWLAASDTGLLHLHGGRAVSYTTRDGLSGDHVLDLFEDREGNIWVSTNRGLDQFRPVAAATHSTINGIGGRSSSVLVTRGGSVWASTTTGVYQLDAASRSWRLRRPGSPGSASLLEDQRGRVWATSSSGLGHFDGDNFVALAGIPRGRIEAMAEDSKGILWAASRAGLLRLLPDGRVEATEWARLDFRGVVTAMAVDPTDDSLWLGSTMGNVVNVANGRVRWVMRQRDPSPLFRRILQIRVERDGTLWVAHEQGLERIKHDRIFHLDESNGLPCRQLYSTLADEHSLWIFATCGLLRIDLAEVNAWMASADQGSNAKLKVQLLDHWDGVAQGATRALGWNAASFFGIVFAPKLTRTSDGRIWVATADTIVSVDPKAMPVNERPPAVHVEQLVSDNKSYEPRSSPRLPPLQNNLAIDYTGISFTGPEQVQFRYMLEGRDTSWQDAGGRRQAFYTDLPPGSYRFRVTAANESGVWNSEGATIDFSIEPAWWQTQSFRAACIAAIALLLYGLYRLRVAQLSRRFNLSIEARVNERLHIARELHDTLLQSFQGMVLRLQTALQLWPNGDGRRVLEESIDQAAEAITEGRDAVQGLRAAATDAGALADNIRAIGKELVASATASAISVGVEVQGHPRPLHPVLHGDIVRIAGEALRNSFRHASPTRIEVDIHYDERELRLRLRDNGKGMDPILAQNGREGHYGLQGMRERAKLIGGRLTLWSRLDAGTEIELRVPAVRAYSAGSPRLVEGVAQHATGMNT